jgi:hypothetical protein
MKVPQAFLVHLQAGDQVEVSVHKTDARPERATTGTPERSASSTELPRPGQLQ